MSYTRGSHLVGVHDMPRGLCSHENDVWCGPLYPKGETGTEIKIYKLCVHIMCVNIFIFIHNVIYNV